MPSRTNGAQRPARSRRLARNNGLIPPTDDHPHAWPRGPDLQASRAVKAPRQHNQPSAIHGAPGPTAAGCTPPARPIAPSTIYSVGYHAHRPADTVRDARKITSAPRHTPPPPSTRPPHHRQLSCHGQPTAASPSPYPSCRTSHRLRHPATCVMRAAHPTAPNAARIARPQDILTDSMNAASNPARVRRLPIARPPRADATRAELTSRRATCPARAPRPPPTSRSRRPHSTRPPAPRCCAASAELRTARRGLAACRAVLCREAHARAGCWCFAAWCCGGFYRRRFLFVEASCGGCWVLLFSRAAQGGFCGGGGRRFDCGLTVCSGTCALGVGLNLGGDGFLWQRAWRGRSGSCARVVAARVVARCAAVARGCGGRVR